MRCSEQYYAASGSCIQCKGAGLPPLMVKALAFVPQQHVMGFLEEMCCQFCMLWISQAFKDRRQLNWNKLTGFCDLVADSRLGLCSILGSTHGSNMQVSIGALVVGACMAIAYFIYSWSPFRRLEGWMKMALRLIFAPGALGDWQQQLVKRQARRHAWYQGYPWILYLCGKSVEYSFIEWWKKHHPFLSSRCAWLVHVVDVVFLFSAQFCFGCYMLLPAGADATARSIFKKAATKSTYSTIMANKCCRTFVVWIWKTVLETFCFDLYLEVKARTCQAPILLQTCQLWSVLSALASRGDGKAGMGSPRWFVDFCWLEHVVPKGLRSNATSLSFHQVLPIDDKRSSKKWVIEFYSGP